MWSRREFRFDQFRRQMFERGDLKYVILDQLKDKPAHGYELIKALEERFGGFYTPSPGAVYPTLQMLEDMGYVSSLSQDGRKVYSITDAGRSFMTERQPQVDGALDGIPGTMTIDTGSASSVDVNTPFVVAHDLRARYHADVEGYPISGIGGAVHAYFAHASELRLGDVRVRDVNLLLTDARAGAEANPSIAANVGDQLLRRFTLVLDYRAATIHFEPPARP